MQSLIEMEEYTKCRYQMKRYDIPTRFLHNTMARVSTKAIEANVSSLTFFQNISETRLFLNVFYVGGGYKLIPKAKWKKKWKVRD